MGALLASMPLAGCAGDGAGLLPTGGDARGAFAPASLRIHPLTHVEPAPVAGAPAGSALLVLHLEVRDRFGDPLKAMGTLAVELYKPVGGAAPGIESQALTWTVPGFDDPDRNSRRFDQSTRTYRVPLVCPGWVGEWFDPDSPVRDGAPEWLKVRAVLTIPDGVGGDGLPVSRFLDHEFLLQ